MNEELHQWRILLTDGVLESSKLKSLCKYVVEKFNQLSLPINELVDARRVIMCLEEIEEYLLVLDHDIEETKNVYDLLYKYKVAITIEDERQLNLLVETYEKLKIKVTIAVKTFRL